MTPRVLIVHYTPPGVVGGVEHIIQQHRALLRERGFQVEVVAGREGDTGDGLTVIPEIDVAGDRNIALEAQLAAGAVGPDFWAIRSAILTRLAPLVREADRIIVHNAFTLHFSLPLTSALWHLAGTAGWSRILAWTHDLSWCNPLYIPTMHDRYPWNLLRARAPGVEYVTVSHERRRELATLWGSEEAEIAVVPNGVDLRALLRLSPAMWEVAQRYRLPQRDAVLLLPVRITRRKNIELGIRALRGLVERGLDALFLISGPQAPHHPGRSHSYLQELQALAAELGVADRTVFLSHERGENLPLEMLPELYALADVLLFPSESEGFGLPILEAGLARVPIVLSDIPIFREVGGNDVRRFDLASDPDTIAGMIVEALDTPQSRLYRRVRQEYFWEGVIDRLLLPLLKEDTPEESEDNRWSS